MKQLFYAALFILFVLPACNTKKRDGQMSQPDAEKAVFKTIKLTEANFLEKVVNFETNPDSWAYLGDKPAIIDFYADWCAPCKAIAPALEELAAEYEGEIYIYKIDTEQEQNLATVFGIRSIPTLFFVPMTGEPQVVRGVLSKTKLKELIHSVLLDK